MTRVKKVRADWTEKSSLCVTAMFIGCSCEWAGWECDTLALHLTFQRYASRPIMLGEMDITE